MSFRLNIRIHYLVTLFFIVVYSPVAFSGIDVDLETGITVGTRTGLFANIYTVGDEAVGVGDDQTGIVSSQARLSPEISIAISSRRIRLLATYLLSLANNVMIQDDYALNLYHQGGLQLTSAISRSLTLSADARIRGGLLDYSTALSSSVSDSEIGANLLPAQQLDFYIISSSLGVNKRLSRRASSGVTLSFNTRHIWGYNESVEIRLPDQYQTTLAFTHNYSLTRRDILNANASASSSLFDPGMSLLPIQATVGWRHTFAENLTLSMSGGLMTVYILRNNEYNSDTGFDDSPTLSRLSPLGTISYGQQFNLEKRKVLNLNISGGYNSYMDQITASTRQRIMFSAGMVVNYSSDWSILTSGSFSSLLSTSSSNTGLQNNTISNDYPTTAYINIGASYVLRAESMYDSELSLTFGISSNARWAELWTENFRTRAFEEFVAYVNIAARNRYLEP